MAFDDGLIVRPLRIAPTPVYEPEPEPAVDRQMAAHMAQLATMVTALNASLEQLLVRLSEPVPVQVEVGAPAVTVDAPRIEVPAVDLSAVAAEVGLLRDEMQSLASAVLRPRVRTVVRDANGNIDHVVERAE